MLCLYALLCCNLFCVLFLYLWVFAINVAWVASISMQFSSGQLRRGRTCAGKNSKWFSGRRFYYYRYLEEEGDWRLQLFFWQALAVQCILCKLSNADVGAQETDRRSWEVCVVFCCHFNHQDLEWLLPVLPLGHHALQWSSTTEEKFSFVRLHPHHTSQFDEWKPDFGFFFN